MTKVLTAADPNLAGANPENWIHFNAPITSSERPETVSPSQAWLYELEERSANIISDVSANVDAAVTPGVLGYDSRVDQQVIDDIVRGRVKTEMMNVKRQRIGNEEVSWGLVNKVAHTMRVEATLDHMSKIPYGDTREADKARNRVLSVVESEIRNSDKWRGLSDAEKNAYRERVMRRFDSRVPNSTEVLNRADITGITREREFLAQATIKNRHRLITFGRFSRGKAKESEKRLNDGMNRVNERILRKEINNFNERNYDGADVLDPNNAEAVRKRVAELKNKDFTNNLIALGVAQNTVKHSWYVKSMMKMGEKYKSLSFGKRATVGLLFGAAAVAAGFVAPWATAAVIGANRGLALNAFRLRHGIKGEKSDDEKIGEIWSKGKFIKDKIENHGATGMSAINQRGADIMRIRMNMDRRKEARGIAAQLGIRVGIMAAGMVGGRMAAEYLENSVGFQDFIHSIDDKARNIWDWFGRSGRGVTTPTGSGGGTLPTPTGSGGGTLPTPTGSGGGTLPDPNVGGGGKVLPNPTGSGGGTLPDPNVGLHGVDMPGFGVEHGQNLTPVTVHDVVHRLAPGSITDIKSPDAKILLDALQQDKVNIRDLPSVMDRFDITNMSTVDQQQVLPAIFNGMDNQSLEAFGRWTGGGSQAYYEAVAANGGNSKVVDAWLQSSIDPHKQLLHDGYVDLLVETHGRQAAGYLGELQANLPSGKTGDAVLNALGSGRSVQWVIDHPAEYGLNGDDVARLWESTGRFNQMLANILDSNDNGLSYLGTLANSPGDYFDNPDLFRSWISQYIDTNPDNVDESILTQIKDALSRNRSNIAIGVGGVAAAGLTYAGVRRFRNRDKSSDDEH